MNNSVKPRRLMKSKTEQKLSSMRAIAPRAQANTALAVSVNKRPVMSENYTKSSACTIWSSVL